MKSRPSVAVPPPSISSLPTDQMRIVPLVERPDLAEQVSVWGFGEWGHLNPGQTLDQRRARIQGKMNVDHVPIAFVAIGGVKAFNTYIVQGVDNPVVLHCYACIILPLAHNLSFPQQSGQGISSLGVELWPHLDVRTPSSLEGECVFHQRRTENMQEGSENEDQ